LNEKDLSIENDYIAYWVQSSPRIEYNHTLEFAKNLCEKTEKPLFIFFILNPNYPEAKRRSYQFLIEGVADFSQNLKNQNLKLNVYLGDPEKIATVIAKNSVAIITDKGYLNFTRDCNKKIADVTSQSFYEIESNLIVPVEVATDHEEYGAYTIRKKINSKISQFIDNPYDDFIDAEHIKSYNDNYGKIIDSFEMFPIESREAADNFINSIPDDNFYPLLIKSGESEAKRLLDDFIENKLDSYHLYSNNPFQNVHSGLSPFLHFGQISPHYIYLKVLNSGKNSEAIDGFLEELVVRRELAFNFCYFNSYYSDFRKILHQWCYDTLDKHSIDKREYLYSLDELENWKTHDKYWNEAQKSLVTLGTMDSYMRMYWAKKILEWSPDPETAFNHTIYLNNRYFLDGRDPNSFTGVAWCYGKHDRAWGEREIFGKIRYMNENGLIKKMKNTNKSIEE
ncbi:MAG: deoxyribodipyrimidine photo-lyase, partial [Fusobacteriaceae bacterium]